MDIAGTMRLPTIVCTEGVRSLGINERESCDTDMWYDMESGNDVHIEEKPIRMWVGKSQPFSAGPFMRFPQIPQRRYGGRQRQAEWALVNAHERTKVSHEDGERRRHGAKSVMDNQLVSGKAEHGAQDSQDSMSSQRPHA